MTEANIIIQDAQGLAANQIIKVAKISGQLDESNVDEKIQIVYQLLQQLPTGLNLIFDLTELQYMNSKSIGYLTDLYGKVSESGGKVAICGAQANILDILQVVGLTQIIPNYSTLQEAIAGLASAPQQ